MTTTLKLWTNGNYVAEARMDGEIIATVGPGTNVESPPIYVPNGKNVFITERAATALEIDMASVKDRLSRVEQKQAAPRSPQSADD